MKICIDAGHGGRDTGAVSKGLKEKIVTISIAHQLRTMLQEDGIDTVMTRSGDDYLGLRDRVTIANESEADYFLSIHTNADPDEDAPDDPEAEGQEIFYLSDAGKAFAAAVGKSLQTEFPDEPWRGLKQRGLYVVRRTSMPAILVEVAFIDHSESNRELRNHAVRRKIAYALRNGIHGILGLEEEAHGLKVEITQTLDPDHRDLPDPTA